MTGRADVTEENRQIARTVAGVFGGAPAVHTWWDAEKENSVDILSVDGSPAPGVTAYATVNLSNTAMADAANDLRVELLGACKTNVESFPGVLSTCAFNVIENGVLIAPGVIFPDVLTTYDLSTTLKHILFVPPFFWGEAPATLRLPKRTVAWLLALPISDTELEHLTLNGVSSLMDVMEAKRPDVFDLNRPSVV
jgi:hypothetical protein